MTCYQRAHTAQPGDTYNGQPITRTQHRTHSHPIVITTSDGTEHHHNHNDPICT